MVETNNGTNKLCRLQVDVKASCAGLEVAPLRLDIREAGGGDVTMKHEQRIDLMIAELYTSGHEGTKSSRYHGMLVYKGESLDTDEGPLLGWIITTTPQTAVWGEYVFSTGGDEGDRVYEMI